MNFKFGPRPEPDPSLKIQSPKGLKLEKIWPDPPLVPIHVKDELHMYKKSEKAQRKEHTEHLSLGVDRA